MENSNSSIAEKRKTINPFNGCKQNVYQYRKPLDNNKMTSSVSSTKKYNYVKPHIECINKYIKSYTKNIIKNYEKRKVIQEIEKNIDKSNNNNYGCNKNFQNNNPKPIHTFSKNANNHSILEINMTKKNQNDINNNQQQNLKNKDNNVKYINYKNNNAGIFFETTLRNNNKDNQGQKIGKDDKKINGRISKKKEDNLQESDKAKNILNCGVRKNSKIIIDSHQKNCYDNYSQKSQKTDKKTSNGFRKKDNKYVYGLNKNDLNKQKTVSAKKIEIKEEKKKFSDLSVMNFNLNFDKVKKKFIDLNISNFYLFHHKIEKTKYFNKLEKINSKGFAIEGKKEESKKNLPLNDKIKDILLYLEQYDLPEDGIKTLTDILNKKITPKIQLVDNKENKKAKKNQSNENEQKNSYDYKIKNQKIEKEESRYQKLYGFVNNGNNCYINSSLQLLTRIKDLKDEVFNFNENYTENETQGRLIVEFRNMLKEIENSRVDDFSLNPIKLKRIMGKIDNKYNYNGQEDSNEFISNFLNALLSETGNKEKKIKSLNIVDEKEKKAYGNLCKKFYQRKGDSFLLNLFYGITKVKKVCNKCGDVYSIKFNVYNMIDFPLSNLVTKNRNEEFTLEQLLEKYIEKKNVMMYAIIAKGMRYIQRQFFLLCPNI